MADESSQLTRHSVRNFSDKPVDTELIKEIIAEAQHAPSWENAQPWKVYVAVGETARKLREANAEAISQGHKSWAEVTPPKAWADKPQQNITDWQHSMAAYMGDDVQSFRSAGQKLYNAPAILYITIPKNSTNYSAYDTGAFGYGILLAAEAHSVNSLPAYSFARYPDIVRQYFDIPEDEAILLGIGLGYATDAKMNQLQTKREPLDAALQIKD